MIVILDEKINENCLLCGNKYKHSIRFYGGNSDLPKEADFITHCATCRNLLSRVKETKKKLKFLETEVEYLMFMKDN